MMPEHWIRLRGGWEWQPEARNGSGGSPLRLTLPCSWSAETPAAVELSRKFQAPRFDPSQESLFLRLERVAGLVRILLNGRFVGGPAGSDDVMIVPIGEPLPPRNQLILHVEPTVGSGWGEIALVITRRGVWKEDSKGTHQFE